MRKRSPIYIVILLLMFLPVANIYSQQVEKDTSSTRSLNNAVAPADSVYSEDDASNDDTLTSNNTTQADISTSENDKETSSFLPFSNDTLNVVRPLSEDKWSAIKNDEDFKYAVPEQQLRTDETMNLGFLEKLFRFLGSKTARVIVWSIVIAILATVFIIYLVNNKLLFTSKGRKLSSGEVDEQVSKSIFDIDFKNDIEQAIANSDWRMATRLHFLQMLKQMSNKNVITYCPDKTNMDYLFELSGSTHFKDFVTAARNYEYVWYGKFAINGEQFNEIKTSFNKF